MTERSDWKWELVTKRVERMPSHIKIAIGSIGALSKDDILMHLQKKDDIGKRIVAMQMNYLKFLKSEAERTTP